MLSKTMKFKYSTDDVWDLISDPDYLVSLLGKDEKIVDAYFDMKPGCELNVGYGGKKLTVCEFAPKQKVAVQFGGLKASFHLTPELGSHSLFGKKQLGLQTTVLLTLESISPGTLDTTSSAAVLMPLYMMQNFLKGNKAIGKINDQADLAQVVKGANTQIRRKLALHKLTDQNVIRGVAENDRSQALRDEARKLLA